MRQLPALILLAFVSSGSVPADTDVLSAPNGAWRTELVNDRANPPRALIVTGWYPSGAEGKSSLVMLVPGRGVPVSAYSRIANDLVLNGYAVVGVDSPGSGRQVFADGRIVPPDPALEPPDGLMAGPYIEVDRFYAPATAAGAGDLRFVLDWLEQGITDSALPDPGQVDTRKVGMLGHSLGGRIAGAFAAADPRVAAWVGVEGLLPREARRNGPDLATLAILSSSIWPYAIENVRELAWCARQPTYFGKMDGITHNTIVDRSTPAGKADDVTAGQDRLASSIVAFFDAHLSVRDRLVREWPAGVAVELHSEPSGERPAGLTCSD